jgi:TRAP transporter TAXI family solute receptor
LIVLAVSLFVIHAEAAPEQTTPRSAGTAPAVPEYKIVTASERGTYIVLGRDLATNVAPDAGFELEAMPSAGSAENIRRLRFEPGVKLAIVQSDVYQAFVDQAAAGNKEAGTIIRPLRVIIPLYNEETYWIVRADAPLNYIHEVKDARINAGPIGSGTALTTLTMYQAMFHAPLPRGTTTYLPNEDALVKLTTNQGVDVVVIVGGQPMKLLADMKPEARQLIKLLRFDPSHPASRELLKTYFPATVRQSSYSNLLSEDLPGVAVKAFLVTYDYNLNQTVQHLKRFARSLCNNMPSLLAHGHPKWKDVELSLPELGEGWSYYPTTAREIQNCAAARPENKRQAKAGCSQVELVLGLCSKP